VTRHANSSQFRLLWSIFYTGERMIRRVAGNFFLALIFARAVSVVPIFADPSIRIREFALLIRSLSEPEGYFDTDNFISNERGYLKVIPDLKRLGVHGGAYLGVGPDQNYSYIAAVRPELAFVVDIRRQNSLQHLYFKALFQLSTTRAEFIGRLFGKRISLESRKAGISDLLRAIDRAPADPSFARENEAAFLKVMRAWDVGLTPGDMGKVRYIARSLVASGPDLKFTSYNRPPRPYYPTYRQLMEETDSARAQSNYLANEETFRFIKKMHGENRIVPVVGDLSGASAMLNIARELHKRELPLTCVYVSNVEFYLFGSDRWPPYVKNLSSFPVARNAYIVRSYASGWEPYPAQLPGYYMTTLIASLPSFFNDEQGGKNRTYQDLIEHGDAVK
jgi:hypothetical protein